MFGVATGNAHHVLHEGIRLLTISHTRNRNAVEIGWVGGNAPGGDRTKIGSAQWSFFPPAITCQ